MVSSEIQESDDRAAPGELELVREFVNTLDVESGEERLATAEALARWLDEHGIDAKPRPDEAALARAIRLREALRGLLRANNEGSHPSDAARVLAAEAGRTPVRLDVDPGGRVWMLPAGGGVDGLVARLLGIVARAQIEGTWARLKTCPADDCAWAFYDESRNSSGTWCSMGVCGNRAKTRRYRSRRRARPTA